MSSPCTAPGCGRPGRRRGMCDKHYQRWRVNGDPTVARRAGRKPTPAPALIVACGDCGKPVGVVPDTRRVWDALAQHTCEAA